MKFIDSLRRASSENKNDIDTKKRAKAAAFIVGTGIAASLIAGCSQEVQGHPVPQAETTSNQSPDVATDPLSPEVRELASEMLDYDCSVTKALDTRTSPKGLEDGADRTTVTFSVRLAPKSVGEHPSLDNVVVGGRLHTGQPVEGTQLEGDPFVIGGSFNDSNNTSPATVTSQEDGSTIVSTQIFPRRDTGEIVGPEGIPQIDLFVLQQTPTKDGEQVVTAVSSCGTMLKNGDNGATWSVVKPRESDITADSSVR
jgi:hypothetical protein